MSKRMKQTEQEKKKPNRDALLIWGIPPDLRRAFRIKVMQNDTTMKDAILKFLREYVGRK